MFLKSVLSKTKNIYDCSYTYLNMQLQYKLSCKCLILKSICKLHKLGVIKLNVTADSPDGSYKYLLDSNVVNILINSIYIKR